MSHAARRIGENLAELRGRIAAAAKRSGRSADAVTLVAVTKGMPDEAAEALVELGCLDLGESRPQEIWSKAAALAGTPVRWHMIGHLQRNKIRRTLPLIALLQSVDSRRLLAALNEEAAALGRVQDVLLEINISLDITKTGLPPEELEPLLRKAAELEHVRIRGLMGMASLTGGLEAAHGDFSRLRTLREKAARNSAATIALNELSMGMSGDFEVAIEEGATIVRVGSVLFEGVGL